MAYNPQNNNGQATMANSEPVVIASNQTVIPVSDNAGSLTVDNAGTFAVQAAQSGTWILGANSGVDIGDVTLTAGSAIVGSVKLSDGTDTADIFDLTNSNPLSVAIVDGNGDHITSFGGGTQYTEDAASAANPVGTAVNLIRLDTPTAITTTDGDNVAQRGTNYGAAYVQIVSSAGAYIDTFGGGTQYTEGDTDASITGTALLWEDTSDTLRAVSAANPLPVNFTNTTVAVTNASLTTLAGAIYAEDLAAQNLDPGIQVLAVRKNTAVSTSGSDGDYQPLITNTTGHLWVDASGQTLTVGSHAVTNAGTFATQVDGSALTALQLIDDTVFTDDAAFTVATSKVNAIGFMADETSTDSVDEGDIGIPRITLDRKVVVTVQPHTKGGWSTFMATSADGSTALTNSAQAIKASAGQFGGYYIYNPNASAIYVHIYNVASGSVTVGTTNPKNTFCIPGASAANIEWVNGIEYDTAISCSATTTGGGNTAPGTALEANFMYK